MTDRPRRSLRPSSGSAVSTRPRAPRSGGRHDGAATELVELARRRRPSRTEPPAPHAHARRGARGAAARLDIAASIGGSGEGEQAGRVRQGAPDPRPAPPRPARRVEARAPDPHVALPSAHRLASPGTDACTLEACAAAAPGGGGGGAMVQIRRRRYEGERRHGDGSRSLLLRRQAGRSLSLVLRGERFRAAPHGLAAAYPINHRCRLLGHRRGSGDPAAASKPRRRHNGLLPCAARAGHHRG